MKAKEKADTRQERGKDKNPSKGNKSGKGPDNGRGDENRTFVVFMGTVKAKYDTPTVKAHRILENGGIDDAGSYILKALDGKRGSEVATFQPGDDVDLSKKHRKFFSSYPQGGGRA